MFLFSLNFGVLVCVCVCMYACECVCACMCECLCVCPAFSIKTFLYLLSILHLLDMLLLF